MFNTSEFKRRRQGIFGSDLYYFENIDSTNRMAESLAMDGMPEGTVVLANSQNEGKGRKGSRWHSPHDVNLYFSVVLRPDTTCLKRLPYIAALSVVRAVSRIGLTADVKWPNDVLVNGKKICGILIETSMEGEKLLYAIIGCGINVNGMNFPDEIKRTATSIAIEKGEPVAREPLLASLLLELETLYAGMGEMSWDELCHELESRSSYLRGSEVTIKTEQATLEGITSGLDPYGGLILQTADGQKIVYSGEVLECRKK